MKKITLYFITCFLILLSIPSAHAYSLLGRMGMGYSSQLVNELPALSFKVQRSRNSALAALVGIRSDSDATNYGFAAKVYRIIYDEPQLNFYMAGLFGYITNNTATSDDNGFQADGTLGAEFFLQGLESIGFSFEFGVSLNKYDNGTTLETTGYNFLVAGIHFYI